MRPPPSLPRPRPPLPSGVRHARSPAILAVGIDDPWTLEALGTLGVGVLRVRYPLPACQRILITLPLAVVVDPRACAIDLEWVVKAAAAAGAPLVEATFTSDAALLREIRRVLADAI